MLDVLLQYVPAAQHGPYLNLLGHVPHYARSIAVAGRSCAAIGALLKRLPGTRVIGATADPKGAALARELLDAAMEFPEDVSRIQDRNIEALVLCNLETELDDGLRWLQLLVGRMSPTGHVYALHGDPALSGGPDALDGKSLEAQVNGGLANAGFHVYQRHAAGDSGVIHVAIPENYNPIQHARDLIGSGDADSGYRVLDTIPGIYLEDPFARQNIWLEKLVALATCLKSGQGGDASNLLGRAQDIFYSLADEFPREAESYRLMAQCWALSGNPAMARRLLNTIQHAAPSAATQAQLDSLPAAKPDAPLSVDAPPWSRAAPFRVLFIMNPRLHFGLDALFDGLCACLGDENVVEYPFKPTLHGQDTDSYKNYACRYNRKGSAVPVASLAADLRASAFDAILYGDVEGSLPLQDVRTLLDARGDCPVYLVDALDQLTNFRPLIQHRLQLPAFAAYFKREMLGTLDYGPNTFPLPFSYAPPSINPAPFAERSETFFWAGHRRFGQRRILLESLEQRYGWNLNVEYDQPAYQHHLCESRIGLNCFGMGFDTVRYWELPAHGCMMLSERLPIKIPFNFENGVHAVFFDDLPDLLEKIEYYVNHPNEVAAIAGAGHAHYLKHHTNAARARQALGWMDATQRAGSQAH